MALFGAEGWCGRVVGAVVAAAAAAAAWLGWREGRFVVHDVG